MHELSICQALIGEVEAVAKANAARSVTDVYVNVGPLSGVEGPLMHRAFPVAAAGTVAANATLYLEEMPIRVRCSACGAETAAAINRLVCGQCGDWRTALKSGDELTLQRVAMQVDQRGGDAYV